MLLEKAKFGGCLAPICDRDVNKLRRTGYVKYHWTDVGCSNVHASVTLAVYVIGSVPQDDSVHESKTACFWYSYSKINCLLMIFVHNYM